MPRVPVRLGSHFVRVMNAHKIKCFSQHAQKCAALRQTCGGTWHPHAFTSACLIKHSKMHGATAPCGLVQCDLTKGNFFCAFLPH